MATLTISTALAASITDSLTYRVAEDSTYDYAVTIPSGFGSYYGGRVTQANTGANNGSLFAKYRGTYVSGGSYPDYVLLDGTGNITFDFKNSANTTLISYSSAEIVTRSIDANGYCVLSNFPQKTPSVAGTIDYIYVNGNSGREITFTVGPSGSGTDIEFDDRTLVTTQPWRLDGSIKFRIPITWTWLT